MLSKPLLGVGVLLWLASSLSVFAGTLNWIQSRDEAFQRAQAESKKVLLIAGRNDCAECDYMHNFVCETTNPPIKSLIESEYVPWFCNIDVGDEWKPYATGMPSFPLPLICTIHPTNNVTYMDRSVSIQPLPTFYRRLLALALIQITNASFASISISNSVTTLELSCLTFGATNCIELATNQPADWVPLTNFVSFARTNRLSIPDPHQGAAYFRLKTFR